MLVFVSLITDGQLSGGLTVHMLPWQQNAISILLYQVALVASISNELVIMNMNSEDRDVLTLQIVGGGVSR